MKYGDLIKERRAVLGMSQQDLSGYRSCNKRTMRTINVCPGILASRLDTSSVMGSKKDIPKQEIQKNVGN